MYLVKIETFDGRWLTAYVTNDYNLAEKQFKLLSLRKYGYVKIEKI